MSMMVSFVLSFFPRDVLDEILNLIESVSEGFPSYSFRTRIIAFGTPKFYTAPYGKINHRLVNNMSSNCDMKSGLSLTSFFHALGM